MHKAPTVDYPVGRSRFQIFALLALWLGVVGTDAMWLLQADRLDWRHGLGVTVSLIAAVLALYALRASRRGCLRWDGQSWWWDCGGVKASGGVQCFLDLQSVLLVGFTAHSGSRRWLWMERSTMPSHWSALRRAVYAPASAHADPGIGGDPLVVESASPKVARS